MLILNVAAGKQQPLEIEEAKICQNVPKLIVNIDSEYNGYAQQGEIEDSIARWIKEGKETERLYGPFDIDRFMSKTRFKFDRVFIYRYLEHVSFVDVPYFIYLISTVTMVDSYIDVIVPDYKKLAEMILVDNPKSPDFEARNILLSTELLNEPDCPHASIWTTERLTHFWELEKRFTTVKIYDPFTFDGRNIYLRAIFKRI
jgi:hypothetical protein